VGGHVGVLTNEAIGLTCSIGLGIVLGLSEVGV
jgi:hypothetical protein